MPVCSFRNIIEQYKKRRFVISCLASAQNHGFSHFTMSLTNTEIVYNRILRILRREINIDK